MIGGLIAGALEGGAKATYGIATEELKNQRDQERMRLEQELAIERDKAITRNRLNAQRQDDLEKLDPEGEYFKRNRNAQQTKLKDETDATVERDGRVRRQAGDIEREGTLKYLSTPGLRDATRAKARDQHIDSPAAGAQAALAAEQLRQLRDQGAATRELVEAVRSGDEDRIGKARSVVAAVKDPLGTAGGKSMNDLAARADQLMRSADKLVDTDPDRAAELYNEAARIRQAVAEKRGVRLDDPAKPGADAGRLDQFKVVR